LNEYDIKVELSDTACNWLAKEGYDPAFGARPLRRAIQKYVESPLSVELLAHRFTTGAVVQADVENEKIIFHTSEVMQKSEQPVEA